MTVAVYRTPMRSHRDDVDVRATIERALRLGLCGFGGFPPNERLVRRIERFADVAIGSLVWTRDTDGRYWLGRIEGPYMVDTSEEVSVDLVHVRAAGWRHHLSNPSARGRRRHRRAGRTQFPADARHGRRG